MTRRGERADIGAIIAHAPKLLLGTVEVDHHHPRLSSAHANPFNR